MSTGFRIAGPPDIKIVLDFMRSFYAIDGYAFDEAIARRALEQFLENSALGSLWLIESAGIAIGYIALTFSYSFEYHGRNAFLDELYIESAYRGQGFGNQAVQFVSEQCRLLGVHALHLEVERTNFAGQALYRKHGFADHGRHLLTKWLVK